MGYGELDVIVVTPTRECRRFLEIEGFRECKHWPVFSNFSEIMIYGVLQGTGTSKALSKESAGATFVFNIRRTDKMQGAPLSAIIMFCKQLFFCPSDLPKF